MATFEQRRRGILRTALELERTLYSAENGFVTELQAGLVELQAELAGRMAVLTATPRDDGNFDWERYQVEGLVAEVTRQTEVWAQRATATMNTAVTQADEMGRQYPRDILRAGGSDIAVRPSLAATNLAAFFSYNAGLVRGVSDKARADVTGLIRRGALGGEAPFTTLQRIGTVTGKGAFATAFHRGEAILRTEMGRSYSSADLLTMKDASLYNPGLLKKWLSIIDGRTRPEHGAAHDQVRKLDEAFVVGGEKLQHPHDPNGSAWNTVNCRCKAVPWDPAWEKMGMLGPLVADDTAEFGSRMAALDRIGVGPMNFESTEARLRDKGGGSQYNSLFDEEMRRHKWPQPMQPSFWRTKLGLSEQQIIDLTASDRSFDALLSERYGIEYVSETYMDDPLSAAMRADVIRALERIRSVNPAWVVENPHLRFIGGGDPGIMGGNTLGSTSAYGEVLLNRNLLATLTGKLRDESGQTVPRIGDDAGTEVMIHELAHVVAFTDGGVNMAKTSYTATGANPPSQLAWDQYRIIHENSGGSEELESMYYETQALSEEWALKVRAAEQLYPADDWHVTDAQATLDVLDAQIRELEERLVNAENNEPYPTAYASDSVDEDFAEAFAMALLQPAEFRSNYPERYAWFEQYYPKVVAP